MRECGIWAKGVDMEYSPKDVGITLKDIGSMIRGKARGLTSFLRRIKFLLGNGSMTLPKQEFTPKWKTLLPSKSKEKNISQTPIFCRLLTKSD